MDGVLFFTSVGFVASRPLSGGSARSSAGGKEGKLCSRGPVGCSSPEQLGPAVGTLAVGFARPKSTESVVEGFESGMDNE